MFAMKTLSSKSQIRDTARKKLFLAFKI